MTSLLELLQKIDGTGGSINVSIDTFLPVQLDSTLPHGYAVRTMVGGAVYVGRDLDLDTACAILENKLKVKFKL